MEFLKFGVLAGLLLAIASVMGGIGGFLLALVFAAVGGALGAHKDGLNDLGVLFSSSSRGRG